MKKLILAMCCAVAAALFSPVMGECAEGYDCIQYIYGTWGVPHSDDIISFDYEGEVVPPEPGYMGKDKPPYARFPYTAIENAYINDSTSEYSGHIEPLKLLLRATHSVSESHPS